MNGARKTNGTRAWKYIDGKFASCGLKAEESQSVRKKTLNPKNQSIQLSGSELHVRPKDCHPPFFLKDFVFLLQPTREKCSPITSRFSDLTTHKFEAK